MSPDTGFPGGGINSFAEKELTGLPREPQFDHTFCTTSDGWMMMMIMMMSKLQGLMWLEGLGKLEKFFHLIGSRTRDF
jgi:hypothetical protein